MYFLATLVRYKTWLTIAAAISLSVILSPVAYMQDPFGIEAARGEAGDELNLGNRNLIDTVASIINVALGLLGIVAVIIILIAGFRWMTAGGNEEQVAEAKKRISQGVVGIAVILASYAIARYVLNQLSVATNAPEESPA